LSNFRESFSKIFNSQKYFFIANSFFEKNVFEVFIDLFKKGVLKELLVIFVNLLEKFDSTLCRKSSIFEILKKNF